MIHIFCIYFIINSFLLGQYVCGEDYKLVNVWVKHFYCFLLLFFGAFVFVFDRVFPRIFKAFDYIDDEIRFNYRFYYTDYFSRVYSDDSSEKFYDSRKKKLVKTEEMAQNSSKQIKRHNRLIHKRYDSKKENS